jgi:hypothetical protein
MLIASKIIEYKIPESATDTAANDYEFMLQWIGTDGGVYNWLFTDFEINQRVTGNIINEKNGNISKIFTGAKNSFTLTAEDITQQQFEVLRSMQRSNILRRVYTDGSFDNLAIISDRSSYIKSQRRYKLDIEVAAVESALLK